MNTGFPGENSRICPGCESASKIVGQNLKKGTLVVLELTVYPGATE